MGLFFKKLFGLEDEEERRQRKRREMDGELVGELTGALKATTSHDGYPLCASCGQRFPIPAKRIQKESEGVPGFMCSNCGTMNYL